MMVYRAYLLRLWLSELETPEHAGWRASLEDSQTGERFGFASLDQLFAFLLAATEVEKPKAPPTDANQPPK
jgi:hypothetical protein